MKKYILILIILIGFVSCSNGQSKDYSKEILGCWRIINIQYEPRSNYPAIDSIAIKMKNESVEEAKKDLGITKFLEQGIMQTYKKNGKQSGSNDYYELKGDSIFIQSSIRRDDQLTSKMTIQNDTLHLIANIPEAFDWIIDDLKWRDVEIPEDLKVEKMMRYTICIRVKDCDQYQE